ncbi:MAG: SH3 domain-containing protein [Lachnospiraceae bacterium]|nr:SH3 domain-containing protein [Lachnospiraceae bacterium]
MKKYTLAVIILLMTFFIHVDAYAEDREINVIVGFEEFSFEDKFIYPAEKLSEDELNRYMPECINAFIKGQKDMISVPVKWKCALVDYENTDYYSYQFSPVWDESKYVMDEGLNIYKDAPYIFVCFGERLSENGILSRAAENTEKNAKKIVSYLTNTVGLSTSAAVGVVANIYYESGCIADILERGYTWENGGGYGLCQWTNYPRTSATGRRTDLINFCTRLGYDYKSLSGQLKYLNYELTTGYNYVLNSLKDINLSSNPENDAYNAAVLWCIKFEIPADAQNAAIIRGNFAKTIWKDYSEGSVKTSAPKLTSFTYPDNIYIGKGYPVTGMIEASPTKLTKVKVSLVNSEGKTVCSKSESPASSSYNVALLDSYITFNKLGKGLYYYKIAASNASGTYTLLNKDFMVSDVKPAVTGYNYPVNIVKGNDFNVYGRVTCGNTINRITVGVYKSKSGTTLKSGTEISVNSNSFDISNFNSALEFNKLSAGTYYYRISAVTAGGTYTLVNKSFIVSPKNVAKVSGLVQASNGSTSITISWKKISGVSGYKIFRSDSPNGKFKSIATVKGYSNIQYKDTGIEKGREYYYKVRAYVTREGKTQYGSYSTQLTARTKSFAPARYKKAKVNTTMYSGAGTSYSKIRTVRQGVEVRVLNYTTDTNGQKWYYVKYGSKYGYIRSNKL